jgi:hypothetical protein
MKRKPLIIAAIAIILCAALVITAFLKARRSMNVKAKKQEQEWQHYTGWQLDGDLNDSGVRLGIGVLRDKKTGVLCTTSGYPGYSACPPQEYVVNGQPTPAPKVIPDRTQALSTATEVFNSRTKCAQLGLELAETMMRGSAIHGVTISSYSAKSNRCYITLEDTSRLGTPRQHTLRSLYDGETGELLAEVESKGPDSKPTVSGHIFGDADIDWRGGEDNGFAKVNTYIDERMKREDQ